MDARKLTVGAINGRPELSTDMGVVSIAEVTLASRSEDMAAMVSIRYDNGSEKRLHLKNFGDNPASDYGDSRTVDYLGVAWEKARAVILSGGLKAVVIDLLSGDVRKEVILEMVDKASLNICAIKFSEDDELVAIVSTWRIVVLDSEMQVRLEYQDDMVASFESVSAEGIRFHAYNLTTKNVETHRLERFIPLSTKGSKK